MNSGPDVLCCTHRGCLDGWVAAALISHLHARGEKSFAIQSVVAGKSIQQTVERARFSPAHLICVDIFPTVEDIRAWQASGIKVSIYDHHVIDPERFALATDAGFEVAHDSTHCGASLVYSRHPELRTLENIEAVVAIVKKYDIWQDPDYSTFCFEAGSREIHREVTVFRTPTTGAQAMEFLRRLADIEAVVEAGRKPMEVLLDAYIDLESSYIDLPDAADGNKKVRCVVWVQPEPPLNPSVVGAWLLADHPSADVACVVRCFEDSPVHGASYRSRKGYSVLDHIQGASGHPCSAGGRIKDAYIRPCLDARAKK